MYNNRTVFQIKFTPRQELSMYNVFLSQIETVLTLALTTASCQLTTARGKTHNIMGKLFFFLLQIRKFKVYHITKRISKQS